MHRKGKYRCPHSELGPRHESTQFLSWRSVQLLRSTPLHVTLIFPSHASCSITLFSKLLCVRFASLSTILIIAKFFIPTYSKHFFSPFPVSFSLPLMRPNTEPTTIRTPVLRIAIIPVIVHAHLPILRATEPCETATHLVLDADTQAIALGSAAGLVRVLDADVAFVALVEVGPAAAAGRVRGPWFLGRRGCGREFSGEHGAGYEFGAGEGWADLGFASATRKDDEGGEGDGRVRGGRRTYLKCWRRATALLVALLFCGILAVA